MEITKHDMDMMKGFTKEVADHIRDFEVIENSGLLSHDSPLYKYKEAVVGLFEKECGHIIPGIFKKGACQAPRV